MLAIRRRWLFVTAAAAALFYVANNYSISGLEHLKIQPVENEEAGNGSAAVAGNGVGTNSSGFDLSQFNIQSFPSPPVHSWGAVGENSSQSAWNHLLSTGEKLAVWQGKLGVQPPSGQRQANEYLGPSVSSPIPIPLGLAPGGTGSSNSSLTPPTGDFSHATPITLPKLLTNDAQSNATPRMDDDRGLPTGVAVGTRNPAPLSGNSVGFQPLGDATIRVASFRVPIVESPTLIQPHVVPTLVAILRHYDLIALQGIQTTRDDVLPLLVQQLNQAGGSYDYLIGPRVGRSANRQQFAFLFDTQKLETDRYQLYTVDDPQDLVNYEPLVAWFRCKGVPPQEAFTFSIVNLAVDPSFADAERNLLPAMIDAIERDGRQEDDWILAGDFAGGAAELAMLESRRVRIAIRDMPTDVAGTQTLDTILFSSRATTEFTGRAGAFDFLRKYNLSIERAMEISSRLPIWAEFSCLEGSQPGRLAPEDPQTVY